MRTPIPETHVVIAETVKDQAPTNHAATFQDLNNLVPHVFITQTVIPNWKRNDNMLGFTETLSRLS
jgi:hypothetical protein